MLTRYYNLVPEMEGSIFLFGARQTGKTTTLLQQFPEAVYIDLLDTNNLTKYSRKPSLLYEQLNQLDEGSIVIIDEIQQVPLLLNEVQRLIFARQLKFILCGSSARKLRRNGYNTLGGRALPCYLYPLVSAEIDNFDIDKAVNEGMLPPFYLSKQASRGLTAYIDVYLKEEIKAESLVRNLDTFRKFLEMAAMTDGEMVNYNNIATDCRVSSHTVKEYFSILEDTLIGYMIPAYTKKQTRRLVQSPKFYLFDVGVTNKLLQRKNLERGTIEYGHAFEHLLVQELIAYIGYTRNEKKLSYWRTSTGIEVDAIIGDADIAIEIKSTDEVLNKHMKNLRSFAKDYPEARKIVVSLDIFTRQTEDGIELVYVLDFLKALWQGKYF